jgi:hypothetical protein
MLRPYNDGLYNVTLFDNATWCCLFYSSDNNVTNITGLNTGTTQDLDYQDFAGT